MASTQQGLSPLRHTPPSPGGNHLNVNQNPPHWLGVKFASIGDAQRRKVCWVKVRWHTSYVVTGEVALPGTLPYPATCMEAGRSTASSVAPDITVCPPWAKSRSPAARFIVRRRCACRPTAPHRCEPDAQDDRGQRLVQLQSTCDGIAGMHDEAIAHALIARRTPQCPAMMADTFRLSTIKSIASGSGARKRTKTRCA